MNTLVASLLNNVEKIIYGKRKVLEYLITALLCEGHVLIEDVPGVGKTQMVAALARSVNGIFHRVQFTPDVMPSDIMGFSMFNPATREFEYREGAAVCNFLLADEVNRTSPKTQSSLLEIMEEFQVTVDGKTYPLPRPYMVLATQNPIESFGTYPLPEAQLDRFFMKLTLGYPDKATESEILEQYGSQNPLKELQPVCEPSDILSLQQQVKNVHMDESLKDYIVEIAEQTRKSANAALGVSPRGSLNLYRASKAWAFVCGRDYVLPDDIQEMAALVLPHRILLNSDARMNGVDAKEVVAEAVSRVNVPVFSSR